MSPSADMSPLTSSLTAPGRTKREKLPSVQRTGDVVSLCLMSLKNSLEVSPGMFSSLMVSIVFMMTMKRQSISSLTSVGLDSFQMHILLKSNYVQVSRRLI